VRRGNPGSTGARGAIGRGVWAVLLLLPELLQAQGLELQPAWNGLFAEDRTTEIVLRLDSALGGELQVAAEGGGQRLEHRARVEPGRTLVETLPVSPGPDGRIEVSAVLPDKTSVSDQVWFRPQRRPLDVEVAGPDGTGHHPGYDPAASGLMFGPDDLPQSHAGYGPVRSLTLSPETLARIDPRQTAALAGYLASCGRLLLKQAAEGLLERIRATAGCSGRFVSARDDTGPGEAGGRTAVDPLPDLFLLEQLPGLGSREQLAEHALLLLLPYPILLLGLAGGRRHGAWLLLFPASAALASGWLLSATAGGAAAVTWGELDAGDAHYRFASLLELRGVGIAQPPLRLTHPEDILSAADALPLERHRDGETGTTFVPFPESLLQARRYLLAGTRPMPHRVGLDAAGTGPIVRNLGDVATPAGWLRWQDAWHPLPELSPGADYRPRDLDEPRAAPPVAELVENASPSASGTLLLLPLETAWNGEDRIRETGWLLVRPGMDS
jgi:hypothetical protein